TGYAGIGSPGNAPSAITAGATDTKNTVSRADDTVAPFSSRGPSWYDGHAKPDVVAPGYRLVSLAIPNSVLYFRYNRSHVVVDGQSYLSLSGTSMSSAVTAGVIATILESYQWYAYMATEPPSPTAVKAMLEYTSTSVLGSNGVAE